MTTDAWIVDASIAAKWFRPSEIEPDRYLAESLIAGSSIRTTTLCVYEVGNTLTRKTRDSSDQIARKLRALIRFCGPPVDLAAADYAAITELVRDHDLTFYDASYVAIARRLGRQVISADRDLLGPGLAVDLSTAIGAD